VSFSIVFPEFSSAASLKRKLISYLMFVNGMGE